MIRGIGTAGLFVAVAIGLAPVAAADGTIADMVENTGAAESPFWSYLYDNGFGYLDSQMVYRDGKIVCANSEAGVPPGQIIQLLKLRGYSMNEAQAVVLAASDTSSVHSFCQNT